MAHNESAERTLREPQGRRAALAGAPDFLTVRELRNILRIGRNQAYALVNSGQIGARRFGGSIRIPRAAIERLLDEDPARG
jgi:excisionase family DNA binding protein